MSALRPAALLLAAALLTAASAADARCKRGAIRGTWHVHFHEVANNRSGWIRCKLVVRNTRGQFRTARSNCRDDEGTRLRVTGGALRLAPRTCTITGSVEARENAGGFTIDHTFPIDVAHLRENGQDFFAGVSDAFTNGITGVKP